MGKLTSELLINEYTRRGFVDGRILRLPTIVVRPGVPSAATSAFISGMPFFRFYSAISRSADLRCITGIIREPLKGQESLCPIGHSLDSPALTALSAWLASPKTTINNFVHAKHVSSSSFYPHTRVVCLPGFTASIKDELDALLKVTGKEALDKVKFKDDEMNRRLVSSWPAKFDNSYPLSLGFSVDEGGMEEVVRQFKKDVEAGLA